MLPVAKEFDVYVTASGTETTRQQTLARLAQLHPLDGARERAFVAGDRVLLRERLSDGEAQRMATGLRSLGVRVDIEAHRGGLSMVELDSFTTDTPQAPVSAPTNFLFDVGAGLVGLDGSDEDLPSLATPPAPPAGAKASGGLLGGLMSISLSDEDAPLSQEPSVAAPPRSPTPGLSPARPAPAPPSARPAPPPPSARPAPPPPSARPAPPPPRPAPPPPVAAAPPPAPPTGNRFGPSGVDESGLNLDLDVVPPDPMLGRPPAKEDAFEIPRCPTHDVPKKGGRCSSCDAEEREVRGKLFGGKLRNNPAVRVGIGVAAGVALGWVITMPMARKGERGVVYIREEADRERARPTEEAQAHAKVLDTQADEEAQAAFFRTLGVWALIVAATTGVWYKLT